MTLSEKQQFFAQMAAQLILQAISMGYEVTLGEAWRPPETAQLYAQEGKGVADSVHCLRLAIDLNLFKSGAFLTAREDYQPLGEWWKSQSTADFQCRWGGDFQRVDSDHFSFENDGIF